MKWKRIKLKDITRTSHHLESQLKFKIPMGTKIRLHKIDKRKLRNHWEQTERLERESRSGDGINMETPKNLIYDQDEFFYYTTNYGRMFFKIPENKKKFNFLSVSITDTFRFTF